jgi:hypothetical protein
MENKIETTFSEAERYSFLGSISVRAFEAPTTKAKLQGILLGILARLWKNPLPGGIAGK